jgi:hypothetical protein
VFLASTATHSPFLALALWAAQLTKTGENASPMPCFAKVLYGRMRTVLILASENVIVGLLPANAFRKQLAQRVSLAPQGRLSVPSEIPL